MTKTIRIGAGAAWGVITPTGALGEGVLSGIASGCGASKTGAFVTAFLTGATGAGRTGGACVILGEGGSINCDSTSAGTISSAVRISSPLCSAHINPTCSATTPRAMLALRLMDSLRPASLSAGMAPPGEPGEAGP